MEQSSGTILPPEFPPPCQGSGEPCLEFITEYNFCEEDDDIKQAAPFRQVFLLPAKIHSILIILEPWCSKSNCA